MVQKYLADVIDNVVHFREVSKIARAEHAGVSREEAIPVLVKLVKNKTYSIKTSIEYSRSHMRGADIMMRLTGISEKLANIRSGRALARGSEHALEGVRAQVSVSRRK